MIEHITIAALRRLMAADQVRVIDVREAWEYQEAHLPGAQWIPMAMVPGRKNDFISDDPVFVVCRSGNRSGQVVMWLAQHGIRTINVTGGTAEWMAQGLPVESSSSLVTASEGTSAP